MAKTRLIYLEVGNFENKAIGCIIFRHDRIKFSAWSTLKIQSFETYQSEFLEKVRNWAPCEVFVAGLFEAENQLLLVSNRHQLLILQSVIFFSRNKNSPSRAQNELTIAFASENSQQNSVSPWFSMTVFVTVFDKVAIPWILKFHLFYVISSKSGDLPI